MNNSFKDFLSYNKRERNGIIVLLAIIVCLLIYLNYDQGSVELIDENAESITDQIQKTNFKEQKIDTVEGENHVVSSHIESSSGQVTLSKFNPNTISEEGWAAMGLKDWQINGIRKYMDKAGEFKSKEDFKKLRVISNELYQKLEPYILLNEDGDETAGDLNNENLRHRNNIVIEVNTASKKDLQALKGIGPVLSARIIKYRDWLGGFYKKNQILEVYGIEDSLYNEIKDELALDASQIKQININKVMTDVLKKHPYVKWRIANAIVNYRDQHGTYNAVSEVKNTDLVNDELYRKIAPYFSLE